MAYLGGGLCQLYDGSVVRGSQESVYSVGGTPVHAPFSSWHPIQQVSKKKIDIPLIQTTKLPYVECTFEAAWENYTGPVLPPFVLGSGNSQYSCTVCIGIAPVVMYGYEEDEPFMAGYGIGDLEGYNFTKDACKKDYKLAYKGDNDFSFTNWRRLNNTSAVWKSDWKDPYTSRVFIDTIHPAYQPIYTVRAPYRKNADRFGRYYFAWESSSKTYGELQSKCGIYDADVFITIAPYFDYFIKNEAHEYGIHCTKEEDFVDGMYRTQLIFEAISHFLRIEINGSIIYNLYIPFTFTVALYYQKTIELGITQLALNPSFTLDDYCNGEYFEAADIDPIYVVAKFER